MTEKETMLRSVIEGLVKEEIEEREVGATLKDIHNAVETIEAWFYETVGELVGDAVDVIQIADNAEKLLRGDK